MEIINKDKLLPEHKKGWIVPLEQTLCEQNESFYILEIHLKDKENLGSNELQADLINSRLIINGEEVFPGSLTQKYRWKKREFVTSKRNRNEEYLRYALQKKILLNGSENTFSAEILIIKGLERNGQIEIVNTTGLSQIFDLSQTTANFSIPENSQWDGTVELKFHKNMRTGEHCLTYANNGEKDEFFSQRSANMNVFDGEENQRSYFERAVDWFKDVFSSSKVKQQ